ncbi:MAG: hypothetical protein H7210_10640, partial [Pyrinomonadaceae bacterium]|nr:hypothetical protein [Phycisphaerales bacterium]
MRAVFVIVAVTCLSLGGLGGPLLAQPGNNTCKNASPAVDGFNNFTTLNATSDGPNESGCGFPANSRVDNDVWFSYVASCTGLVTVDVCGVDFDSRVAIYGTACPAAAGTTLACDDDACGGEGSGGGSRVAFAAVAGAGYLIRVGGFNNATGTGVMLISCPPNNDACENATDLCTLQLTSAHTLIGATGDGSAPCGISSGAADVWYVFTAPWPADLFISTCGSHDLGGVDIGVDTVLSIHSGCPGTIENWLECNDDTDICFGADQGFLRDSSFSRSVAEGETVWIRASHFGDSSPGNFLLNISFFIVPNDACAGAQAVVGNAPTRYCTLGAGTDGPSDCPVNQDAWFTYTADCTDRVRVSLCDSTFDTVLAVYAGSCGALDLVAGGCNDDNGPACPGSRSSVEFDGLAGTSYTIRVGGVGSATGSGTL